MLDNEITTLSNTRCHDINSLKDHTCKLNVMITTSYSIIVNSAM